MAGLRDAEIVIIGGWELDAGHDDYEIEVFGEAIPATRQARALYDPKRERILA